MCYWDWDNSFDTPLDYTQTISPPPHITTIITPITTKAIFTAQAFFINQLNPAKLNYIHRRIRFCDEDY